MCHLLLVLPLAALPLFWLLPLPAALVLYTGATGISLFVYWQAMRVAKRPMQNGNAALLGDTGTVVAIRGEDVVVQLHNELWDAVCPDGAPPLGSLVTVKGCGGAILLVEEMKAEGAPRQAAQSGR